MDSGCDSLSLCDFTYDKRVSMGEYPSPKEQTYFMWYFSPEGEDVYRIFNHMYTKEDQELGEQKYGFLFLEERERLQGDLAFKRVYVMHRIRDIEETRGQWVVKCAKGQEDEVQQGLTIVSVADPTYALGVVEGEGLVAVKGREDSWSFEKSNMKLPHV